jgi:hypothetical protein
MLKLKLLVAVAVLVGVNVSALADHDWRARNFPPPNGGLLVFKVVGGNPQCASYNAHDCLWGQDMSQIDFSRVNPLSCGKNHLAEWGVTGYETPNHWCNLAK